MHARHPFTVVERYSAIAQLLHWTTVLIVVAAYIASVGGLYWPVSTAASATC